MSGLSISEWREREIKWPDNEREGMGKEGMWQREWWQRTERSDGEGRLVHSPIHSLRWWVAFLFLIHFFLMPPPSSLPISSLRSSVTILHLPSSTSNLAPEIDGRVMTEEVARGRKRKGTEISLSSSLYHLVSSLSLYSSSHPVSLSSTYNPKQVTQRDEGEREDREKRLRDGKKWPIFLLSVVDVEEWEGRDMRMDAKEKSIPISCQSSFQLLPSLCQVSSPVAGNGMW